MGAKRPQAWDKKSPCAIAEYLQQVDVFKDLTREEIEALFEGVMVRECTRGTVFFTPEDPSQRLFILKEGHADIYQLTLEGKRLVTRRIEPGTIFGATFNTLPAHSPGGEVVTINGKCFSQGAVPDVGILKKAIKRYLPDKEKA